VSNTVGSVTSLQVLLSVNSTQPPIVNLAPKDTAVTEGQMASFTITATGTAPLAYQWQKNGIDISGATSSSYTFSATRADSGAIFRCIVSNTTGKDTSDPAILRVTAAGPIVSDDFNATSLNNSLWTLTDPKGDAVVTQTGGHLSIAVPAGISHDLWTGALLAPRILQSAPNSDFTVEAKFDALLSAQYQLEGILVQQDNNTLLRFDFLRDNLGVRIFAASIVAGTATARNDVRITSGSSFYMRVARSGDSWTQSYSYNGTTWTTAANFIQALTVRNVGLFAGNHGEPVSSSPAFTALVDYFSNTAAPVSMQAALSAEASGSLANIIPHDFILEGNYPNPFNPSTIIRYGLPEEAKVSVRVYSILGQEVSRLADGYRLAGTYEVHWDGRGNSGGVVSTGVYLYRMVATGVSGKSYVATKRMVLVK
jgi:hypothetical protein